MPYYLACAECAAVTTILERGWRALLTDDEHEPKHIVVFCPECAEREFGPPRKQTRSDEN
jgi:hypothetical protein